MDFMQAILHKLRKCALSVEIARKLVRRLCAQMELGAFLVCAIFLYLQERLSMILDRRFHTALAKSNSPVHI